MDPISALSIACNVLQLVEQAIEAAEACKELYDKGSLDQNDRIEQHAEEIKDANKALGEVLGKKNMVTSPRAKKLENIAKDASATASELQKILNQLKLSKKQGKKNVGGAFKTTLRMLWKRGDIERLRKKLKEQDKTICSGILKELYVQVDTNALEQKRQFQNLSKAQQDTIANVLDRLKNSETSVIAHLATQDAALMQSERRLMSRMDAHDLHLNNASEKQDSQWIRLQNRERDALRVRLLDSLAFPEMNERRNVIESRIGDFGSTCKWIFNPGHEYLGQLNHEFVDWLRNGSQVFWVSGKPGSGKSSLMAYIYQSLQKGNSAFEHLARWAQSKPIRVLSFWFFRPAASQLLKSASGLWRSLCWQILDKDEKLIDLIRVNKDMSAPSSLHGCLTESGSRAQTWTDAELQSWVTYLLTQSSCKYCILLDGLDEVESRLDYLLHSIRQIAQDSEKIKVCCSSRPENPFLHFFHGAPSLKLQDLNRDDIVRYCEQRLEETEAAHYARQIAARAEGVFLWACLVADDMKNAASQSDTKEELEMRLQECPSQMDDLFSLLLERQDKFYANHPKPYLQLIAASTANLQESRRSINEEANLLELLLAAQDQKELMSRFPGKFDDAFVENTEELAVGLEANIVARCAGLVECTYASSDSLYEDDAWENFPHKSLAKAAYTHARFIHRSAQTFLLESKKGAALMSICGISEQDALLRLMLASAIRIIISREIVDIDRSLHFARTISIDHWTPSQTTIADLLSEIQQTRKPLPAPWEYSLPKSEYFPVRKPEIVCPRLSLSENIAYNHAINYFLVPYFNDKADSLKEGALGLMASHAAICLYNKIDKTGWSSYSRENDDNGAIERIILPHVSWTETITLYHWASWLGYLPITCTVRQHIQLIYFRSSLSSKEEAEARWAGLSIKPETLLDLQSSCTMMKGWIVGFSHYMERFRLFRIPDDSLFSAMDESYLAREDIFEVEVCHYKGRGFLEAWKVRFCRFSPRTLGRWFDIDDELDQWLNESLKAEKTMYDMVLISLNHLLSNLLPEEIAKLVGRFCHEYMYSLDPHRSTVFSNCQFRSCRRRAFENWVGRLSCGSYEDDFPASTQGDPVLLAILQELKHFLAQWPIQAHKICLRNAGWCQYPAPSPYQDPFITAWTEPALPMDFGLSFEENCSRSDYYKFGFLVDV